MFPSLVSVASSFVLTSCDAETCGEELSVSVREEESECVEQQGMWCSVRSHQCFHSSDPLFLDSFCERRTQSTSQTGSWLMARIPKLVCQQQLVGRMQPFQQGDALKIAKRKLCINAVCAWTTDARSLTQMKLSARKFLADREHGWTVETCLVTTTSAAWSPKQVDKLEVRKHEELEWLVCSQIVFSGTVPRRMLARKQ